MRKRSYVIGTWNIGVGMNQKIVILFNLIGTFDLTLQNGLSFLIKYFAIGFFHHMKYYRIVIFIRMVIMFYPFIGSLMYLDITRPDFIAYFDFCIKEVGTFVDIG
jgi:hypothetical protein